MGNLWVDFDFLYVQIHKDSLFLVVELSYDLLKIIP